MVPCWYDYHGKDEIYGGMVMSEPGDKPVKRRDFLGIAAFGTFLIASATACFGIVRLFLPKLSPELSRRFEIGEPQGFLLDEVKVPVGRSVYVFHDTNGFYAISAKCTHLGCIVSYGPHGFSCPCHGSRFAADGRVVSGSASKALEWYAISLAPNGQLVVDEGKTVKTGTFFNV